MPTNPLEGHVYQAIYQRNELLALLKQLFGEPCNVILRNVSDITFQAFKFDEIEQWLTQWSEGQLFNHATELRWRKQGEVFALLLLTENVQTLPGFSVVTGSPFQVVARVQSESTSTHGALLWGTRAADGQWRESRVPRSLDYKKLAPEHHQTKPPLMQYNLYQVDEAVRWVRLVKPVEELTNG